MESTSETLAQLANCGAFDSLEERWLAGLPTAADNLDQFLETSTILAGAGEKDRACVLLMMLYDDLWGKEQYEPALEVLEAVAQIRPNEKTLRPKILETVRAVFRDQPGLELFIDKSELAGSRKVPDALKVFREFTSFQVGCHVFHSTGWGTGKVIDFDAATAELTIDFEEDKGHSIPVSSARDIFDILDNEDLRVYKLSRRDELQDKIDNAPADVLKLVLKSRGGKALASEIRNELRESVIPQKIWSKWWTKARREAAKDPFIEIKDGTKPLYLLREKPVTIADEALKAVAAAKTLPQAVSVGRGFVRKAKDSIDTAAIYSEIRKRILALTEQERDVNAGSVLEALIFLEDSTLPADEEFPLNARDFFEEQVQAAVAHGDEEDDDEHGETAAEAEAEAETEAEAEAESEAEDEDETADDEHDEESAHEAVADEDDDDDGTDHEPIDPELERYYEAVTTLLAGVSIQEYRNRFVGIMVEVVPEYWPEILAMLLQDSGSDLWDLGITTLRKAEYIDLIGDVISEIVAHPVRYPESYLPFARGYLAKKYEDLPDMPTPLRVITQLIRLYEKCQRRRPPLDPADVKKILTRAETILLDPKSRHMETIFKKTTLEEMTRIFNEAEASPYLSMELRNAIHTTVARSHPILLTERSKPIWEDENLYTTAKSIDEKQEEFRILTEIKIPENSRAVGAAAALGDLSENSEYTSALESQRLLTEKAEVLRAQLDRARLIENLSIPENQCVPGTRVRLRHGGTGESRDYQILGPWEAGEDDSIISYLSPLGSALMGHKAGEDVEAELPTGTQVFHIESIEPIYI